VRVSLSCFVLRSAVPPLSSPLSPLPSRLSVRVFARACISCCGLVERLITMAGGYTIAEDVNIFYLLINAMIIFSTL